MSGTASQGEADVVGGGQGARAHSLPRRPAAQPCSGALTTRRRRHGVIGSLGRPPRHARTAPQPWPRARSHKGGVLAGRLSIPLGRHLLGPKPPSAGLFLRRSLPVPPSPPCDPPSATSDARKRLPRNLLAVRPARVGVGRIYRFMKDGASPWRCSPRSEAQARPPTQLWRRVPTHAS